MAGAATAGVLACAVASPHKAGAAATQDWSPFVLVVGLLLIGRVADRDGLFAAAGHLLARVAGNGLMLFLGSTLMLGTVTALLNLDTSVAFLTPVLVYTARSRGGGEAPLLYAALLLSNAGSLFLPGSNLTNLIVLGPRHLSGAQFFSHMWLPALAALLITAAVIIGFEHRNLGRPTTPQPAAEKPDVGLGLFAIIVATVLVVALHSPALPVVVVGLIATVVRLGTGRDHLAEVTEGLGVPILVGLFGLAVTLGTVGRLWSGPSALLSHLNVWGTAAMAAASSVVINNLPAASLLSARTPSHPFALLIGLNLGPNLFVTGSLAWLIWYRSAKNAGADPQIGGASRIGLVAVPLSIAAAVGLLALTGSS